MTGPTWGAVPLGDGYARFRLWAPTQQAVALHTPRGDISIPAAGDGWFQVETDAVAIGAPYAFRLDDGTLVPDPASRAQQGDVHGPSLLVDPAAYQWQDKGWAGRPWEEAVIYELHVGTFTPAGTFAAAIDRLDHLADLGITAIELMPVAQFSGNRGWGYDGVLPYAPHRAYGTPDDMRALVDAAHARGLMVLLDVVYNHFGPDGNYLPLYAPDFFDPKRSTPWGPAIAYDKPAVRAFFLENIVTWLEGFHLDGLRFDAIDQIRDPSPQPIIEEMARVARARIADRPVHLTTEDHRNIIGLHKRDAAGRPTLYTAEWNDDFHNIAHVVATGETEGYYQDFADDRLGRLARALAEGYVYQGEPSPSHDGAPRGEPCSELPLTAFVDFLQNHDQVGNRARGERLGALADPALLDVLAAMLILSPSIPLLFMGEEFGATTPFCFFTDFDGDLADVVREGRRREFAAWRAFADEAARATIPDPNAEATFAASRLDWNEAESPAGRAHQDKLQQLLACRRTEIVPRLAGMRGGAGTIRCQRDALVAVTWRLGDGSDLHLDANIADQDAPAAPPPSGRQLHETTAGAFAALAAGNLPAMAAVCSIAEAASGAAAQP